MTLFMYVSAPLTFIALGALIYLVHRASSKRIAVLEAAVEQMQEVIIGLYEVQQKLDGEWEK